MVISSDKYEFRGKAVLEREKMIIYTIKTVVTTLRPPYLCVVTVGKEGQTTHVRLLHIVE